MDKKTISKEILEKIFDDFEIAEDLSNKEYLEKHLLHLEGLVFNYKRQSENPDISSHERARARDYEQNCIGLINGIRFGISFLEFKDVDLMEIVNGVE